jgi:tRNA modification GTPase
MYQRDTIAAIATPAGMGGIGIIKISGPDALHTIAPLFRSPLFNPTSAETRHLYFGTIIDPQDSHILDEVLVSYMRAPRTYTCEDVVEINCHSGFVILQKILELVLQNGARLAEPGEFTKRAFLNGRIDLTQAEAVIDIIEAKTEAGLKIASRQLHGSLSDKLHALHAALIDCTMHIEAAIDFPEDEIEAYDSRNAQQQLSGIIAEMEKLSATYQEGRLYRLGVHTIIVGKPNVGKSSILNALLGEERALVTPFPGTTRDFIQETISIQGIPMVIQDTAGLHEGQDEIDKMGMHLTRSRLSEAELVLFVIDGSQGLDDRDRAIIEEIKGRTVITIINKADLPWQFTVENARSLGLTDTVAQISALHNQGLDHLKELMYETVLRFPHDSAAEILITSARQKNALDRTLAALNTARTAACEGLPPELIAIDLHAALQALGEITGQTSTEDILDRIFSTFCIGK